MNANILFNTPTIPDEVYSHLPPFIRACTDQFSDRRERDVVLVGLFSVLGVCLSDVRGKYARDIVAPNLFALVVAPAGCNKRVMKYAKLVAQPLQDRFTKENKGKLDLYNYQLEEWKKSKRADKGLPPAKPLMPVLIIPGNSTAASIHVLLHESGGTGLIVETETDTLSGSIKSDWGNYSDLLRKSFHHENLSVSRKGSGEYFEIKFPILGILLSGTPDQTTGLIPSSENGLFSRFLFYCYKNKVEWMDTSPCEHCEDLTTLFLSKGEEVKQLADTLKAVQPSFLLSPDQFNRHNQFFIEKLEQMKRIEGDEAASSVYRLGLISYKVALTLSVLRSYEKGIIPPKITCEEGDLTITLQLAEVFFQHTLTMLSLLPQTSKTGLKAHLRRFFEQLPGDGVFSRKTANEIGRQIGVAEKTTYNFLQELIAQGYLKDEGHGKFRKGEQEP